MNLNLYSHNGHWLMVDCGVTFDEPLSPDSTQRFRVVAADPSFITAQKERLIGIVITHAHEDHIGAVAHLWRRFGVPVYTTGFTAEVLRRKLAQVGLDGQVPVYEIKTGAYRQIGPFGVHWLGITHSVPEPHALLIETAVGSVLHTADWKIDKRPGVGQGFEVERYKQLAEQNISAMVCDSTNALKPGFSISEGECKAGLYETIKAETGRVVVTCFASNLARLIALARIAEKTGRYMALLGRSLKNMYSIARVTGYWPDDLTLIDASHVGYLPKNEVLIVATGSQGEPRAAVNRLALDNHPQLHLDGGDCVIFSAMIIPGNERPVEQMVERLKARNIVVHLSEDSPIPIHASGHPNQEELALMYQWVKPQIAIPVHGEAEHIEANTVIARQNGVSKYFAGNNGDLYQIAPQPMLKRGAIKAGRIIIEAE